MAIFPGIRGFFHKVAGFLFDATTSDPTVTTTTGGLWMRSDVLNGRLRFQDYAGVVHSLAHYDELTSPTSLRQALTGAGTANLVANTTRCTTAGVGDAVALAAGAAAGWRKTIVMGVQSTAGDTTVITPTGLADGTTITLRNVLDSVTLESTVTGWIVVGYSGTPVIA